MSKDPLLSAPVGERLSSCISLPERLQGDWTLSLLKSIEVSFFVIDEAHCISHWGHDFREDYRNLSIIKKEFKGIATHAFTATATKEVQGDILGQLRLDNPRINIASVDRANLTYRIEMRSEIIQQITGILKNTPGSRDYLLPAPG